MKKPDSHGRHNAVKLYPTTQYNGNEKILGQWEQPHSNTFPRTESRSEQGEKWKNIYLQRKSLARVSKLQKLIKKSLKRWELKANNCKDAEALNKKYDSTNRDILALGGQPENRPRIIQALLELGKLNAGKTANSTVQGGKNLRNRDREEKCTTVKNQI